MAAARWSLLGMVWLLTSGAEGRVERCPEKPECSISRAHGMKSADCYKRDLHHFPKCLASDVEVIDLSYNRIREITSRDMRIYSNLKFLYLGDNMIMRIDPDAFADKTDLLTLDLSYNGFSHIIPDIIFQLPSLKNLYLSQNQNINIIDILDKVEIKSPLQLLDIAYNTNEDEGPKYLPDLGIMGSLIKYNISGMDLTLRLQDTAGLCNLKYFVNDNLTARFEQECDCPTMETWFKQRKIWFRPLSCRLTNEDCPFEIPDDVRQIYDQCNKAYAEELYQAKLNNTLMIVGIVSAVVLFIAMVVLWRYKRRKTKKRRQERMILSGQ